MPSFFAPLSARVLEADRCSSLLLILSFEPIHVQMVSYGRACESSKLSLRLNPADQVPPATPDTRFGHTGSEPALDIWLAGFLQLCSDGASAQKPSSYSLPGLGSRLGRPGHFEGRKLRETLQVRLIL